MELKAIKSERDYRAALAEIGRLFDANPRSPAARRLEVLSILVEEYEDRRFPIAAPDAISAIEFRMDQQGLTRRDLEAIIGSRARVSEILNRKRPLTLAMIRRLHNELGIPAESLLQQPPEAAE